jgi:ribosomal protein S27AE
MDYKHEFFKCDKCDTTDFKRIYNFSLRFHGVNFSDELIYDRLVNEKYQCVNCGKTFSMVEIEEALDRIKKRYKKKKQPVDE